MTENPQPTPVDETGDPDAIDTGDFAEVEPAQQSDVDVPVPNDDADQDLSNVGEGEVVQLVDAEDSDDDAALATEQG